MKHYKPSMPSDLQLCKFLVQAKKSTFAAGSDSTKTIETNKSTTLQFKDGDFQYHDNYFGGEPFGGREVVFWKGEPIYIMTYYGWINESVPPSDFNSIYKVLQEALLLIPETHPFRGPEEYTGNNLIYKNDYTGKIDNFYGKEIIRTLDGKQLYQAKYMGGYVNKKK